VAERALETLEALRRARRTTERPWFLVASFFGPHPPYIVRREDLNAVAPRVASKSTMYEESVGVPAIFRGPGFGIGAIDDRVASLLDVSATLLALGGASLPPGHRGRDLRAPRDGWEDTAFSEYYGGLMNIDLPPQRRRMVRQGRHKLVHDDGWPPALYDLDADPDEIRDISGEPAMRPILDRLLAQAFEDWDPERIGAEMELARARTAMIRDWARATSPPETARWRDPDPARNRHE
jgi:choline-sulfatase